MVLSQNLINTLNSIFNQTFVLFQRISDIEGWQQTKLH